jgi:predicted nucleic acid-binding protein
VFDTQALLVLYLGEEGSDKVVRYLEGVSEGRVNGYLNLVNLTELYYILRRVDKGKAEEKERNLRSFGVRVVPVAYNSSLWKQAAVLKADYSVSLGDSFAAATAILYKGTLLTGSDIEFEGVRNLRLERAID